MKAGVSMKAGAILIAGLLLIGLGGCRNRTEGVNAKVKTEEAKAAVASAEVAIVETVSRPDNEFDYPLRIEKLEKYQLKPGARVEVSRFNGRIEIEPVDGDEAEVYLVRSARERDDFKDRKVMVEYEADKLKLWMERERRSVMFQIFDERGGERQRLILRLPRRIALSLESIGGRLKVGEFDGSLKIDGVYGRAEVSRAAEATEIDEVSGNLKLIVNDLKAGGVKVDSVHGRVDVQCGAGVNADVAVEDVHGRITRDLAAFVVNGEPRNGQLEGRIGKGGSRIEISDINGGVRFGPIEAEPSDEKAPKVVDKVLKVVVKDNAAAKTAKVK